MKSKIKKLKQFIPLLILIAVALNIVLTLSLILSGARCKPADSALPCAAVPIGFVAEYPQCADRLVESLNITNVRIRRLDESRSLADNLGLEE